MDDRAHLAIRRAAVIGITWPIAKELDDTAPERELFAPADYNPPRSKPLPEWGHALIAPGVDR